MSWKEVDNLITRQGEQLLTVGVYTSTGGRSRIGININKVLAYTMGVLANTSASMEVGEGVHEGFVRILFNRKDGKLRVTGNGGTGAGLRVSARTWPGVNGPSKRARVTDYHWDADTNVLTMCLPAGITGKSCGTTVRQVLGSGGNYA